MKTNRIRLPLLFVLFFLVSACGPVAAPDQSSGPVTIRMVVLPILDGLPMYVADQEGLFEKHGVNIEFIPVGSAPERDQLINARQADGMINEVVSVLFYNKDQVQVQIVRFAQTAAPDRALFRILAAGSSGITTPEQLKGVEIGISQGTVIDYLTDRLLQAEGLSQDEVRSVAVPKIDQRMALLGSGELKAAMLPEPLSSLAEQGGAVNVVDDTSHPEYSYSTYTFRKEFIDQNPEAIRSFLAAVEEAVTIINSDPQKWNSLLTEKQLVPAPLAGSFIVSKFATAGVPTQQQWDDVVEWAKTKGLLEKDVLYSESVDASFLP